MEPEKWLDEALQTIPEGEVLEDGPIELEEDPTGPIPQPKEKPLIPQTEQLAYLTLLNKITPKQDTLKQSIKARIKDIKRAYGLDDL